TTLPGATYGTNYNQLITASEPGCSSFVFLLDGALPNGMFLGTDGTVAGPPQAAGSFSFPVLGIDANGFLARRSYTLNVAPATPTVAVSDGGIYNAQPFAATATAVGVDGTTPVAGRFSFTYYTAHGGVLRGGAPVNAGTYIVVASFTSSDPNY